MLQNQAALKRGSFANFKTNHNISYAWKNNLVLVVLAKKIFENWTYNEILMISQREGFFGTPTVVSK